MPPSSCRGRGSCSSCGLFLFSIRASDAAQDSTLILSVKCNIFFLLYLPLVPLDSSIILTPIVVINNIVPALGNEDSMKGGIVH